MTDKLTSIFSILRPLELMANDGHVSLEHYLQIRDAVRNSSNILIASSSAETADEMAHVLIPAMPDGTKLALVNPLEGLVEYGNATISRFYTKPGSDGDQSYAGIVDLLIELSVSSLMLCGVEPDDASTVTKALRSPETPVIAALQGVSPSKALAYLAACETDSLQTTILEYIDLLIVADIIRGNLSVSEVLEAEDLAALP